MFIYRMGKTFASLYIASLLKVKTLVIVNKESLLEQWSEQIIKFLGYKTWYNPGF